MGRLAGREDRADEKGAVEGIRTFPSLPGHISHADFGVFLGHLSSENNEPHLAYETVSSILEDSGIRVGKQLDLDMASRYSNSRMIEL